jgi:hypothetical protein
MDILVSQATIRCHDLHLSGYTSTCWFLNSTLAALALSLGVMVEHAEVMLSSLAMYGIRSDWETCFFVSMARLYKAHA